MGCFLGDLRAFGINAEQWTTAAQDEGECHRTAEQGAERFMAKWIAAKIATRVSFFFPFVYLEMSLFPSIFCTIVIAVFHRMVSVCVCLFSSHLFWTSGLWTYQPGSHRRKVTQDFSSTFLLRCLPKFFSREGFSRSFPSSTVKLNFGFERINRFPLVRHFFSFSFCEEKSYLPGFELTSQHQKVSRLPTEPSERPVEYVVRFFSSGRCLNKNMN